MPPKPLVSILIDNYNYGRYLPSAIDSALGQTYANTEVIIVDDGSTDESRDVIAGYGTSVSAILKENGGQASAFNAGFAACRGEIICLLDADDYWDEEKAEVIVNAISSVRIVSWSFLRHNLLTVHEAWGPNGSSLGDTERLLPGVRGPRRVESISSDDVLALRRDAPSSALCISREALHRMGSIRPESRFRISADAFLFTHLPRYGVVISIPDVLGRYRVHSRNRYFTHDATAEHLRRVAATEMALLNSLPESVRYNDTLLRLAHLTSSSETPYLADLGPLSERLRRIFGPGWRNALSFQPLKMAVREIIRTVTAVLVSVLK